MRNQHCLLIGFLLAAAMASNSLPGLAQSQTPYAQMPFEPVPVQPEQMPMQQGQMPMQQGQMPMQQGQMPMQQGRMPMQQGQMLMQQGQMLMQQGQIPMQQGQIPMQQGQIPMQARPQITSPFVMPDRLVDFNSGKCLKTELDLESAQFLEAAVDKLHMSAQNLDMKQGLLGSLEIIVNGGHFEDFTIDQVRINSKSPMAFSADTLLNKRVFEFSNPALANVSAIVSQNSLNRFVASPKTLQMLSLGAQNHLPSLLGQLVGAALQVRFQSAGLKLLAENCVQIDVVANVDLMAQASLLPVSVVTRLGLANGWLNLSDTRILASGQELAPEISSMVVERINRLALWGSRNDDIHFTFTRLNVIPGERFELLGTAQIKRLRFGS